MNISDPIVIERLSVISGITLFGSRYKGNYTDDSDVDIIIEYHDDNPNDIRNSIFHLPNDNLTKSKTQVLIQALGINPNTNKPYDIQIVGRYELRFFSLNSY